MKKVQSIQERNPLNTILGNSERLLCDAEILRKRRRYGSALSLAILSIEEIGKCVDYLAVSQDSGAGHERKPHRLKQSRAAEVLIGKLDIKEASTLLAAKGLKFVLVPKTNEKPNEPIARRLAPILGSISKDDYVAIAPKLRQKIHVGTLIDLTRGTMDQLKQQGFYVDLSRTGDVISDPSNVNRELVDRILRTARQSFAGLKRAIEIRESRVAASAPR